VFCLATAFLFHTNFAVRNELLHFEKDLAIAGGMFVLMVCGAGRWSSTSAAGGVRGARLADRKPIAAGLTPALKAARTAFSLPVVNEPAPSSTVA